jgi:ATP-dependent RNA helicase
MYSQEFDIITNYEVVPFDSYSDLGIKDEIIAGLKDLDRLNPTVLHRHTLRALLSKNSMIVSSPSGTGKSLLMTTALLQLINKNNPGLQFIILEGMAHLVKETYDNLLQAMKYYPIKIDYADTEKSMDSNYKAIKHSQVIVAERMPLIKLLNKSKTSFSSVMCVVIDGIKAENKQIRIIMEILRNKVPNTFYWWFKHGEVLEEPEEEFKSMFLAGSLEAIVKLHICDIREVSHSFVLVTSFNEKIEYLKKIIKLNREYQKIIYCFDDEELDEVEDRLADYRLGVIKPKCEPSVSAAILKDFFKKIFEVLVCSGRLINSRRIKSDSPLYIIFMSIVEKEIYNKFVRRSGNVTNDRIFVFKQNNNDQAAIEEYERAFSINISQWPNINDL